MNRTNRMRMEQLTKEISELQNELSELENKECGLILTESEENNISKLEEKIFDAEVVHIKINKPTIVDVVLLDDKGRYSIEGLTTVDFKSTQSLQKLEEFCSSLE